MTKALDTALAKHEEIMDRTATPAQEFFRALLAIRDRNLFRGRYDSFEAYCKARWGIGVRHGNRLLVASEVMKEIENRGSQTGTGAPKERVLRELAVEPKGKRAEALDEATEKAGGEPTAKQVRKVVEARKAPKDKSPKDTLGNAIKHKHVIDAFTEADELQYLKNRTHGLSRDIAAIDPIVGHFVEFQQIATDLKNVASALKFAVPYAVCPYCKGEAKSCRECRYSGWVPERVYKNIPKSVKK